MSDYGGDDDAGAAGADFDFEAAAYVSALIASTLANLMLLFDLMVVTLIITMSVSIYCCGALPQKRSKDRDAILMGYLPSSGRGPYTRYHNSRC